MWEDTSYGFVIIVSQGSGQKIVSVNFEAYSYSHVDGKDFN